MITELWEEITAPGVARTKGSRESDLVKDAARSATKLLMTYCRDNDGLTRKKIRQYVYMAAARVLKGKPAIPRCETLTPEWQANLIASLVWDSRHWSWSLSREVSQEDHADVQERLEAIRRQTLPPSSQRRSDRQKLINAFKSRLTRARQQVDERTGEVGWVLHEDLVAALGEKEAGRLWDSPERMCFTLEQAWVDNRAMTCAEVVSYAIKRKQTRNVGLDWWRAGSSRARVRREPSLQGYRS